jgi:sugar lactone lactonase YvrE
MRKPALALALATALALLPSSASAATRPRWDTRLLARIQAPGFPASAYPHRNGRVYVGTYVNPNGDSLPSRVLEFRPTDGTLLRSWTVPGQDLTKEHGIQAATSDAAGRLVLLDHTPPRALILNIRTGEFTPYATFADLKPCSGAPNGSCSPTAQDLAPSPNYAAWGPDGSLYVTDYQQAVVWRVPPGGGDPVVWLADRRLDGQQFGTTGLALAADTRTLIVGQGSTGGSPSLLPGGNPTTGRLYRVAIRPDGSPGEPTELWQSGPADLPDGFGIARSGRIYVALAGANQIAVVGSDGSEVERFPAGADGANGSPVPFDTPSSAKFLGTRLMVPNQAYTTGDVSHQALLDVETGEPGLPELIPPGAGGVDSTAPALAALSIRPGMVRRGVSTTLRLRLSEAARVSIRIERRTGPRWRAVARYARAGRSGANAIRVSTRVNRGGRKQPLGAGFYRMVVRAADGAGNSSRDSIRHFRIR